MNWSKSCYFPVVDIFSFILQWFSLPLPTAIFSLYRRRSNAVEDGQNAPLKLKKVFPGLLKHFRRSGKRDLFLFQRILGVTTKKTVPYTRRPLWTVNYLASHPDSISSYKYGHVHTLCTLYAISLSKFDKSINLCTVDQTSSLQHCHASKRPESLLRMIKINSSITALSLKGNVTLSYRVRLGRLNDPKLCCLFPMTRIHSRITLLERASCESKDFV